jgi:hypothetical protein
LADFHGSGRFFLHVFHHPGAPGNGSGMHLEDFIDAYPEMIQVKDIHGDGG